MNIIKKIEKYESPKVEIEEIIIDRQFCGDGSNISWPTDPEDDEWVGGGEDNGG